MSENNTIREDVPVEDYGTGETGADEFLKRWMKADGESPSAPEEEPSDSEDDEFEDGENLSEDDSDGDDDNEPHDDDGERKESTSYADIPDDKVIKRKIDGKEVELRIGDLVKSHGLEQANTRKAQENAEHRKTLEQHAENLVVRAQNALNRAYERFKPYQNADFIALSHQLTPDQYEQYKHDAIEAAKDVQVFEEDLKATLDEAKVRRQKQFDEYIETTAKATHAHFTRPDSPIPNYSEALVDEMFDYAVTQYGIPQSEAHAAVETWKIQLFHDAMMYRKGHKAVAQTSVVQKTSNKVVKSKVTSDPSRVGDARSGKALENFKKNGGSDSTDVWLERWRGQ